MKESSTIQSVDRALTLLFQIANSSEETANLENLAELINVNKSTVFRMLTTLSQHGLIQQNKGDKKYKLGFGIYTLASSLENQNKISDIVSPYLKLIAAETFENSHLVVRSGDMCVLIDYEIGRNKLSFNTRLGDTEDLYASAVGKCLISDISKEELNKLYPKKLLPHTQNTITDLDELYDNLTKVFKNRIAIDDEENENDIFCIASPIINYKSQIIASIGISGPVDRMKLREEKFKKIILEKSIKISNNLGYLK
jgi:DNA-binding IclR family transcriptional regulator